jgi:DNA topoisomerase II
MDKIPIILPEPQFPTFEEHAKKRSMWKGSSVLTMQSHWFRVGKHFEKRDCMISDALLKCFDEVLVNAIDQYINTIHYDEQHGGTVTRIEVDFDPETGYITVCNTGQGMPVCKCESLKGRYSVEGLITRALSGTNFDDDKDPDRVTGGINGLGLKLVNVDCLHFEIETVDYVRGKYYRQICKNSMTEVLPPEVHDITKLETRKKLGIAACSPHTKLKFLLDYASLCKNNKSEMNHNWYNAVNAENFMRIIEFRCYETAAFVASINYRYQGERRLEYLGKKPRIIFNGVDINIRHLGDFMEMFGVEKYVLLNMESDREQVNAHFEDLENEEKLAIRFPWYVAIGLNTKYQYEHVSILNGVHLEGGGKHLDLLMKQLCTEFHSKLEKMSNGTEVKPSMVKNALFVIHCKQIPIPEFSGQTKNNVTIAAKDLQRMSKTFHVPVKETKKLWNIIRTSIEYSLFEREKKNLAKRKKMFIRKYTKAERLGKQSMLIVDEGDSAEKITRDIIHSKQSALNYKHCGIYNIQGVPMNARRKIKKIIFNGKLLTRQHPKLVNNIGLQGLAQILGLSYDEDYYFGPPEEDPRLPELSEEEAQGLYAHRDRGDEMFAKLPYGSGVIIATDQDSDGIGQICSLLLVFFMCFWPDLIKRGFVRRLATPIIRVYHGSESQNFYSEREFDEWTEQFGGQSNLPTGYKVEYYKGLSSHTEEEVLHDIGANIMQNIYTFTWDDACEAIMELMYSDSNAKKKDMLRTPVTKKYDENLLNRQLIRCSDHFEIESKTFQLKFMRRKLKCAIDGLIPSQRKALAGARARAVKKLKVYQLTGYVTEKMGYQHGDSSMNQAIIKMAQTFTGGNNIPVFMPISNGFGDRVNGRGVSGSPRYIDTQYNARVMDLLFPRLDDYLLDYEYEEGEKCEPSYYVPILPYAIMETTTTTSVGWQMKCWARSLPSVVNNVRRLMRNMPMNSMTGDAWIAPNMRVAIGKYPTGGCETEICHGVYKYNENSNTIIVKQLPLRVWSGKLGDVILGKNSKGETLDDRKELVTDYIDRTANDRNHIIIRLKPGAMDNIKKNYGNQHIDPVEHYLGLTQNMQHQLNMFKADGSIKEFDNYEDVIAEWYPVRKHMYQMRLERMTLLLEIQILYYQEMLRFIKMDATKEINIDKDYDDVERERILSEAGFVKFNKEKIHNPGYIRIDQIRDEIMVRNISYKYIDDITVRMKSQNYMKKLQLDIENKQNELQDLRNTNWKKIWDKEIKELMDVIKVGQASKWLYGTKQHTYKKYSKGT